MDLDHVTGESRLSAAEIYKPVKLKHSTLTTPFSQSPDKTLTNI